MTFTKLSSMMFPSARKIHLEDEAKAALVINVAKEKIMDIFSNVSSKMENLISQLYFTKSTLYIHTTNSSVSHELHLRQEDLLQEINKALPEAWVSSLKIKVR